MTDAGRESEPDFEAMYRADPDPWRVESSWYERRKLAVLLASLPREHYRRAWEPGSGPGVTSQGLAARVDDLVASDGSPTALELAGRRAGMPSHVRFLRSQLPAVPLCAAVDLVVVAEVLYYLPDLPAALDAVWSACEPAAHVVFVHWTHHPHDGFTSGRELHTQIGLDCRRRGAAHLVGHVDRDFVLDVYERTP